MKKQKTSGTTIRRVLSYLQHYRLLFVLTLLLAAVTVAVTLIVPIMVGRAIDLIISESRVNFSALSPIQ